jgi:hypothetical protein
MARIFMRPLCTEDARSCRDENCGLTPVPVSVLGWSTGPQGPVAGGAASLRGHSAGDRLIGRLGGLLNRRAVIVVTSIWSADWPTPPEPERPQGEQRPPPAKCSRACRN